MTMGNGNDQGKAAAPFSRAKFKISPLERARANVGCSDGYDIPYFLNEQFYAEAFKDS